MIVKPTMCDITKDHERLWSETRIALSWYCPAFTHIFLTLLDNTGSKHIAYFTKEVPIAATDGEAILINPDKFFKYDLQERVFILVHEIMHAIFNHLVMLHKWKTTKKVIYPDGKKLPFYQDMMNVALDLVINDIIIDAKIGKFNKDWLHDPSMATKDSIGVDVYRSMWERLPSLSLGGKSDDDGDDQPFTYKGKQRFDEHLEPGVSQDKDPQQASMDREADEVKWQTEIAAGAETARQQGKLPAGLDQFFKKILTPQVDWKDKIKAAFARKLGTGAYDWQRADHELIVRDIYAPARSGFGAGIVIIGIDTSGSIVAEPKLLDMFLGEVSGILDDAKPREVHLLWCDAYMQRADVDIKPEDLNFIRDKSVPGGGGTDFRPVFDWVRDNDKHPDAIVYLTDGEGLFPERAPPYDVIWGYVPSREGYSVKFPFGEVITIPKQVT